MSKLNKNYLKQLNRN